MEIWTEDTQWDAGRVLKEAMDVVARRDKRIEKLKKDKDMYQDTSVEMAEQAERLRKEVEEKNRIIKKVTDERDESERCRVKAVKELKRIRGEKKESGRSTSQGEKTKNESGDKLAGYRIGRELDRMEGRLRAVVERTNRRKIGGNGQDNKGNNRGKGKV